MNRRGSIARPLALLALVASAWTAPAGVGGGGIAMPGAPDRPRPAAPEPATPATPATPFAPAAPRSSGPVAAGPVRLLLQLQDGSMLGGAPAEAGPVFDSTLGTVQPAWADVAELVLSDASGGDTIRLRSGDQARGDLRSTLIGVTSVLGRARISTTRIRRVDVGSASAAGGLPSGPRDGLVLYYAFDSDERERITDLSGRENHGRLIGSARFVRLGRIGGAFEFTGGNRIVQQGFYARHFATRHTGTFAFWVNQSDPGSQPQAMVANSTGSEHFEIRRDGGLRWEHGHQDLRTDGGLVRPGEWHHIAGVLDLNGTCQLYVDGQPAAQGHLGAIYQGAARDLELGVYNDQSEFNYHGLMDELRIYDRALDSSEVRDLCTVRPAPAAGAAPAAAAPLRIEASLKDSTVVKGTASWTTLPLRSASFGSIELPWRRVVEVRAGADGAEVLLDSGDLFKGELAFQRALLDSSLGRVALTPETIQRLRVLRE